MATPRKHWFKVPDSIADEDWDNDVLATLIRLQARMNTRWARNGLDRDEAAEIVLTAGDAMSVTRRSSFRRASELLSRCQEAVTAELHVARSSVKFTWPKWPEFQGLPSRESPESRPRVARSETPPQTQTQTQTEAPAAPAPACDPDPPPEKTAPPEPSADAQRIAGLLAAMIRQTAPPGTPIRERAWARELDPWLGKTGRSPPEVEAAIEWLRLENPQREARFVVQSASKLKARYSAIRAAMERRPASGGTSHEQRRRETALDAGRRVAIRRGLLDPSGGSGAGQDRDEAVFDAAFKRTD